MDNMALSIQQEIQKNETFPFNVSFHPHGFPAPSGQILRMMTLAACQQIQLVPSVPDGNRHPQLSPIRPPALTTMYNRDIGTNHVNRTCNESHTLPPSGWKAIIACCLSREIKTNIFRKKLFPYGPVIKKGQFHFQDISRQYFIFSLQ